MNRSATGKPAPQSSGDSVGAKSLIEEALGEAQKAKESLKKALEPFSDEAKDKIKDMAAVIDEVASKSSKEARSFLAKTLQAVAEENPIKRRLKREASSLLSKISGFGSRSLIVSFL